MAVLSFTGDRISFFVFCMMPFSVQYLLRRGRNRVGLLMMCYKKWIKKHRRSEQKHRQRPQGISNLEDAWETCCIYCYEQQVAF